MHGRHTEMRRHHWVATVLAVVAVLALALVFAWSDRGPNAERNASAPAASAPADAGQRHACRAVWRAQSRTLDAAGSSLEQWRVHVDAMNQLVAGQITLDQAMAFWNQTRQGAAARVAKFETVDGAYADATPRCAGINGGPRPAGTSRALWHCVSGLRARDRAIQAGTVAVTTWKHHIQDMEMLRTGQITPQQATQMWLRNWHLGVSQLHTFTNARDSAAHAPRC